MSYKCPRCRLIVFNGEQHDVWCKSTIDTEQLKPCMAEEAMTRMTGRPYEFSTCLLRRLPCEDCANYVEHIKSLMSQLATLSENKNERIAKLEEELAWWKQKPKEIEE